MRNTHSATLSVVLLAVSMVVGASLATLPHWWTGDAAWVADHDELAFYLPVGAAAYRDHPWHLSDPVTGGPTYYESLPNVPGVILAKALGLGPWHLGLCWRLYGGLAVGATWYLLLRTRFGPRAALTAACLLMADRGVLNGQLGYALAKAVAHPLVLANSAATPTAASLPQWRILDPVLVWPWWLAFFALVARAVNKPSRGRVLVAGISCGTLFYVYFYLWTTAVAGLALAAVLDRVRWRVYVGVVAVGLTIGLPAVITSIQFRVTYGAEWLQRTDKFLPVDRFDELLIPRVSVVLLAATWLWVLRRGPEWRWLAAMASAALLLLNHTVVTGLQIENSHWNYALGPALSLLLVLVTADLFGRLSPRVARAGPLLAGTVVVVIAAGGSWLYGRAATGLPENDHVRAPLNAFRNGADRLALPSGAVAGDPDFQYLAAVGFNTRPLAGYSALLSPISNAELDARVALNGRLLGWSRARFASEQDAELRATTWGAAARSAEARAARLAARLAAYDATATDIEAALERFDVQTLARPASATEPAPAGWILADSGPRWDVWVRPR